MKWFGTDWQAAICHNCEHVEAPVDQSCQWCEEQIQPNDNGVSIEGDNSVFHLNCFLRIVFGSVGHQQGNCSCFGGTEEDPPGMTKRQAAEAAARLWYLHHPNPPQKYESILEIQLQVNQKESDE